MQLGRDKHQPTLRERIAGAATTVGAAGHLSTLVLAATLVIAGLTLILTAVILGRVR